VRAYAELRGALAEVQQGQAELVQTEKMAALGKLGAGAAHEINNPLAAIVGNAELLLRREALTPGARERVERVLQAAHRAARVIRQLLAFVRPQLPETSPTDVVDVLRDVVAERARELAMDGIRLLDELEPVPAVAADGRQLAQVFANILDNALDAVKGAPPGVGRTIRLTSHPLPGGVRIRIENSGLPIAAEALPRIFDPFYTTKPVGRGAGLGLSVCKGIVSAHGGRIVAENLPGGVAILVDVPTDGTAAPSDSPPPD
jgi:signal transduction histidine kinase